MIRGQSVFDRERRWTIGIVCVWTRESESDQQLGQSRRLKGQVVGIRSEISNCQPIFLSFASQEIKTRRNFDQHPLKTGKEPLFEKPSLNIAVQSDYPSHTPLTANHLYGWVWFYGISTIVGYLMPNPFYTYKQFYFEQFTFA